MKPKELLERLRFLSTYGKVTDIMINAPVGPTKFEAGQGAVTCGDLLEFVDWVDHLQENSWKYEGLNR